MPKKDVQYNPDRIVSQMPKSDWTHEQAKHQYNFLDSIGVNLPPYDEFYTITLNRFDSFRDEIEAMMEHEDRHFEALDLILSQGPYSVVLNEINSLVADTGALFTVRASTNLMCNVLYHPTSDLLDAKQCFFGNVYEVKSYLEGLIFGYKM
ncbi:hypothetical protein ACWA2C_16130 [Priestia megaterium]